MSLAELARFSAALGRDPEQVQAAGGNTSLKADGTLWVKASGLWLADALSRDLFVPVDFATVEDGIARDLPDPVAPAVRTDLNPAGLRPSIETTLHALLPHAVVVHTHSVRTIAFAVQETGETHLKGRLAGLPWAWIPYCKPGLPLTRAVAEHLRRTPADILILGNHGLVVGGASVAGAAALLAEVERRLDLPTFAASSFAPPRSAPPGLRPVAHPGTHALATDPGRLQRACAGSLYPDHVIFLGPAALPHDRLAPTTRLHLLPGVGAFLPETAIPSADELALCLALVLERVPPDAKLRYLSPEDEAELLDWDAEKYRQALAAGR